MSKMAKDLKDAINKAKTEFEMACICVGKAMQDIHERLERLEEWMKESQEKSSN